MSPGQPCFAQRNLSPYRCACTAQDHAKVTDEKKILRYRSQALSGLEGMKHFGSVATDPDQEWETGPIRHPDPRNPGEAGIRDGRG